MERSDRLLQFQRRVRQAQQQQQQRLQTTTQNERRKNSSGNSNSKQPHIWLSVHENELYIWVYDIRTVYT